MTIVLGTVILVLSRAIALRASAILIVIAGSFVAAIGYIDDRRGLAAAPRFAVHVAASLMLLAMLILEDALQMREASDWLLAAILTASTIWSINLFNFMDGIDGIAASQAIFVTGASAALVLYGGHSELATLLLLTAGACAGFLPWNWAPAKIFMGDIGSGFLGFWLWSLALVLHVEHALSIWTSIILGSVFIADATATLLVRVAARKRWYEAHRSHAYQHLSRQLRSHAKVTALVWAINGAVVLPLAVLSTLVNKAAPLLAIATVVVFAAFAMLLRAGQDEHSAKTGDRADQLRL